MESLFLLIITLVVVAYFRGKPSHSGSRQTVAAGRQTGLPEDSKTDHGSFVRYQTSVKTDAVLYLYLSIDIQKAETDYVLDIKSKVTDSDGTDFGDNEDIYNYNVKSRKWIEGSHPFDIRTPASFISFMVNAWQEVNGPLPERTKKPVPTHVSTTEKIIELPQYNDDYLKDLPAKIEVAGSEGQTYLVNLAKLICTCPDFKKRRTGFPQRDVRRICKHLAKEIVKQKLNTKISEDNKLQAFVRKAAANYRGVPLFKKIIAVKIDEQVKGQKEFYLLIDNNDKGWVDVILFTNKTYGRHGYNINEKRWAYGKNPFPHGDKIKYNLAIQQAFKKCM